MNKGIEGVGVGTRLVIGEIIGRFVQVSVWAVTNIMYDSLLGVFYFIKPVNGAGDPDDSTDPISIAAEILQSALDQGTVEIEKPEPAPTPAFDVATHSAYTLAEMALYEAIKALQGVKERNPASVAIGAKLTLEAGPRKAVGKPAIEEAGDPVAILRVLLGILEQERAPMQLTPKTRL